MTRTASATITSGVATRKASVSKRMLGVRYVCIRRLPAAIITKRKKRFCESEKRMNNKKEVPMVNDTDENNILQQIGDDPFVKGSWFFTVAWFVIRLIAVIVMFFVVVFTD